MPGRFYCSSHSPMSSPSMRTPGVMPGSWPSASARSARTRWWRCQSSGQGQFQSGSIAVSCAARSAARSGSYAAHSNPQVDEGP